MLVRPSTFYHTVVSAVVHLSASVLLHQLEEGLRGHQTRAGEGPRELNPTILLFRGRRRLLLLLLLLLCRRSALFFVGSHAHGLHGLTHLSVHR